MSKEYIKTLEKALNPTDHLSTNMNPDHIGRRAILKAAQTYLALLKGEHETYVIVPREATEAMLDICVGPMPNVIWVHETMDYVETVDTGEPNLTKYTLSRLYQSIEDELFEVVKENKKLRRVLLEAYKALDWEMEGTNDE